MLTMKRTLIAVTLVALGLSNAVFAEPTIFSFTGEESMHVWKSAPEATTYQADARGGMEQDGIYSFNP